MTQPDGAQTPASRLRLADLGQRRPQAFTFQPEADTCAQISDRLALVSLRKARLDGHLVPVGSRDWDLEARLGATVVQSCVTTLAPVRTRIDEDVTRRYRQTAEALHELTLPEIEMPEDDTVEPLPDVLDLAALFEEALALALPAFPRAPDATLDRSAFAAPGETPLTDEDVKPFAALAALKRARDTDDRDRGDGAGSTDHSDDTGGDEDDGDGGTDRDR